MGQFTWTLDTKSRGTHESAQVYFKETEYQTVQGVTTKYLPVGLEDSVKSVQQQQGCLY